ncbi:hypothetical protein GCN74_09525 [Janthinobacterium sp. FT14W]|uniref:heparin lyase I family protein n=1 Tax=Janthinobacterium sp. FT14W TaxID=2654253 RepID=UPI00126422CA|nr:heparin lyase I family protein [Janthinobacterium sp. FT14W]KAB8060198.1 hypothetical protein GCN74_09525 [Janthinobacterium sp. FT14W]
MQLLRLAAISLLTVAGLPAYVVAAVFPAVPAADIAQHFTDYYGVRQHAQQRVQVTTATVGGVTRPVVRADWFGTDATPHSDFHLLNEQHPAQSTRRWYAMSIFLPADWISTSAPITVAQVDNGSGAGTLAPPLALQIRGDQLMLNMNFNHRTGDITPANSARRTVLAGPATLGSWHCMVVRADWSAVAGTGELRVYMNGSAKETFFARLSHNSYAGALHVPRAGLSVPEEAAPEHRVMYADFVWVGDSAASLNDMTQKTPCHAAS